MPRFEYNSHIYVTMERNQALHVILRMLDKMHIPYTRDEAEAGLTQIVTCADGEFSLRSDGERTSLIVRHERSDDVDTLTESLYELLRAETPEGSNLHQLATSFENSGIDWLLRALRE